jgi:beta-xylosidase
VTKSLSGAMNLAEWYFEVWNEPNIDFWAGEPKQATYVELYDHAARTLNPSTLDCASVALQPPPLIGFRSSFAT